MSRTARNALSAVVVLAGAIVVSAHAVSAQPASRVAAALEEHLYAGRLEAAERALSAIVAAEPDNAEGRFALGGVLFVRAVERFGQSLHRHGFQTPRTMFLPMSGLPLPTNMRPEPLTYEGFRAILARLVDDLDAAQAELARIGEAPVKLTVDIARIRLDLDDNGVGDDRERLSVVVDGLARAARRRDLTAPGRAGGDSLPAGFDLADVYWLRGYANLVAVSAEFFLAYDFRTTFDATFHLFFPRAGLPFGRLVTEPTLPIGGGEWGSILDAVAFIHLVRWDVAEPRRLASIHARLKSVIALNRKTWAAIRAETDDDNEWLPGPHQKGVLDMPVTEEMIDSWLAMLDELEAVLDGHKLTPHMRFNRGINIKKVLTEPRPFDLVLWITGHGALPFLEDGPVMDTRTWARASLAFRGQFMSYAFWFN
jgi:hypothetical protein